VSCTKRNELPTSTRILHFKYNIFSEKNSKNFGALIFPGQNLSIRTIQLSNEGHMISLYNISDDVHM
jgi:hypothetical protein